MRVSVAMAAYNGEKFISQQMDSILSQLREKDELIVSCNPSKDRTWDILSAYMKKDPRVKAVLCEKKGVLKNFENAILLCTGDIIFLSDQDDIWEEGKVEKIKKLFKADKTLGGIVHGHIDVDENGKPLPEQPKTQKQKRISTLQIIIKNPVQGSCFAFRRAIVDYVLPLPEKIPMHDSYIGLAVCKLSKLIYIPDPFLLYRSHSETVTTRRHKPLPLMIRDRIWLIQSLKTIKKRH